MKLLCRFCNFVCGEFEKGIPLEFADIRCDNCLILYGDFKGMENEYYQDVVRDNTKFKKYMDKCHYKKSEFDSGKMEEIKKNKPKVKIE